MGIAVVVPADCPAARELVATATIVTGAVDNYLHEMALANQPPSKTVYDPEKDGKPLASLGVHEHWNNAADKKYSRNLGSGAGIELVALSGGLRFRNPQTMGIWLVNQRLDFGLRSARNTAVQTARNSSGFG